MPKFTEIMPMDLSAAEAIEALFETLDICDGQRRRYLNIEPDIAAHAVWSRRKAAVSWALSKLAPPD